MTIPIMTAGQLRERLADVPADTEIVADMGSLDEFYELRIRTLLPAVKAIHPDYQGPIRFAPALVLELGQEITTEKALIERTDDYMQGDPR